MMLCYLVSGCDHPESDWINLFKKSEQRVHMSWRIHTHPDVPPENLLFVHSGLVPCVFQLVIQKAQWDGKSDGTNVQLPVTLTRYTQKSTQHIFYHSSIMVKLCSSPSSAILLTWSKTVVIAAFFTRWLLLAMRCTLPMSSLSVLLLRYICVP